MTRSQKMIRSHSKNERIQESARASTAPEQVVSRPIPALSLLIAQTHQSALLPTASTGSKLSTSPESSAISKKQHADLGATMDTVFPVAPKVQIKEPSPSRQIVKTDSKLSIESKLSKQTTYNKWTAEAYSIFEGMCIF